MSQKKAFMQFGEYQMNVLAIWYVRSNNSYYGFKNVQ